MGPWSHGGPGAAVLYYELVRASLSEATRAAAAAAVGLGLPGTAHLPLRQLQLPALLLHLLRRLLRGLELALLRPHLGVQDRSPMYQPDSRDSSRGLLTISTNLTLCLDKSPSQQIPGRSGRAGQGRAAQGGAGHRPDEGG